MFFDLDHAKQFLATASLPLAPAHLGVVEGMGMPELEMSRQQSLVVGSNVVSFTTGVEVDVRQAITDSSLFAQLAAAKAIGTNTDPLVFFDAYFANLVAIGWMIQKRETAEFTCGGGHRRAERLAQNERGRPVHHALQQAEPARGDWPLPVHLCLSGCRSRSHGGSHGVLSQGRQHPDSGPVLQAAKRQDLIAPQHGQPFHRCRGYEVSATAACGKDERLSQQLHRGR